MWSDKILGLVDKVETLWVKLLFAKYIKKQNLLAEERKGLT